MEVLKMNNPQMIKWFLEVANQEYNGKTMKLTTALLNEKLL